MVRVPPFDALPADGWRRLSATAMRRCLSRGERAAPVAGGRCSTGFVESGLVAVLAYTEEGRPAIVDLIGRGGVLLPVAWPSGCAARAVTSTVVVLFPESALRAELRRSARAAMAWADALARQAEGARRRILELASLDAPARVARALLSLNGLVAPGDPPPNGRLPLRRGPSRPAMSQDELAQLVGCTRETVNRCLRDFARSGWVRMDRRGLDLVAPDQLRARAGC